MNTSVIPFASRKISTLVDGTLRLSVDIDPIFANAAFKLFSMPGTPGAIAALTNESAQAATHAEIPADDPFTASNREAVKPPTGIRCRESVGMMKEKDFANYVKFMNRAFGGNDTPKEFVQIVCGIESRREFDEGRDADEKYAEFCGIKKKYREWQGRESK